MTDFGLRDPSAAICKAVVLGIAPDALVVDISHEVAKYQISDAALLLWCALPYLPVGAHVAVVDPGVGTERRGIAMETVRGDVLVGPDNGLLLPGARRLGGVTRAHLLENAQYRLPVVSSSFHGRDLFAPAAAHLAIGVPVEALGREIDPATLNPLDWPEPELGEGFLATEVLYVDTFGNIKLSAETAHLAAALPELDPGSRLEAEVEAEVEAAVTDEGMPARLAVRWVETFGRVEPGDALLYEDSYGRLCLAENQGSLADRHGLRSGMRVKIRPG
ncbi:MAG: SAM-dependent chlorinase/fluorinase [Chloroflexi bacterium]|nr:SAM-dependent chlorinase/fluorinase [Chloroflexota bacterium]